MITLCKDFFRNEQGATAIEYGLIAALIAAAIIVGTRNVGSKLSGTFTDANAQLGGAAPASVVK